MRKHKKPCMYIIDEGLNLLTLSGELAEPIYEKIRALGYDEMHIVGHENVIELCETLKILNEE